MSTIIEQDIAALMHDLKALLGRVGQYKQDADRGLNVNTNREAENYPARKRAENLADYLVDTVHDFDRIGDDLKEIMGHLEKLQDAFEYEVLASKIR